jgi:hypothetical protein
MYRNADLLPDGAVLSGEDYDLCIVGAGAAGIAMATRLIGSSKRVLVLSNGLSDDNSEEADPSRQRIYAGTVGPLMQKVMPDFLTRMRLRMYGGTTNHFNFWARPLEAVDLLPRPGYRDASWPLEIAELNRYYPDANAFGDYGPFNYDDLEFWTTKVLRATPFPSLPNDRLMNAIFHSQYQTQIQRFQLHYGDDLQAAENVTVLFNANALRIDTTEARDHVTGLACATIEDGRAGKPFRVEVGAYVLAQGGIECVRLLKLSGDLGDNAKGHLGRGFMSHCLVTTAASVQFFEPVDLRFFQHQQVMLPRSPSESGECRPRVAPIYHPSELKEYWCFHAWGVLTPTPAAMEEAKIGNFRAWLDYDAVRKQATINFNCEQVPNEESLITLDTSNPWCIWIGTFSPRTSRRSSRAWASARAILRPEARSASLCATSAGIRGIGLSWRIGASTP